MLPPVSQYNWRAKRASLLSCQLKPRYVIFCYLSIYIYIYLYLFIYIRVYQIKNVARVWCVRIASVCSVTETCGNGVDHEQQGLMSLVRKSICVRSLEKEYLENERCQTYDIEQLHREYVARSSLLAIFN